MTVQHENLLKIDSIQCILLTELEADDEAPITENVDSVTAPYLRHT